MMLLYYILIVVFLFKNVNAAQDSLINCSWPCPIITNSCIVTPQGASCRERRTNEWMINTPEKSPVYTGAYVTIEFQSCDPVPIPRLPPASLGVNTTQIGQSIIRWPIQSTRRPYDNYLGNCGHGFYCSSIGDDEIEPICRQRLAILSTCFSSNQCLSGSCVDNTCQLNSRITGDRYRNQESSNYDNKRTARILAAVFGIIGGIIVIAFGFVMYSRHKDRKALNEQMASDHEETVQQAMHSFSASGMPLRMNDDLHKQFASDFQNEGATSTITSVMHQSQLQHQQYDVPPPSYKP